MRIIDADKIKKPIYAEEDNATGFGMSYDEMCGYNDGIDDAFDAIRCTPTIDAVPVVRCKDCKYRATIFCHMVHETLGNGLIDWATDDGYCNHGVRKKHKEK